MTPRWFRWRGRIWHLRVYRDRRDQWVGRFLPGVEMRSWMFIYPVEGWDGRMRHDYVNGTIDVRTVYVCPLPTLVVELWRYES